MFAVGYSETVEGNTEQVRKFHLKYTIQTKAIKLNNFFRLPSSFFFAIIFFKQSNVRFPTQIHFQFLNLALYHEHFPTSFKMSF